MNPGKKRTVGLLSILIVLLGAWILHRARTSPSDPLYGGVRLSTHLYTLYAPRMRPAKQGGWTAQEIASFEEDNRKRTASRNALYGVDTLPEVISFDMPRKVGLEAAPLIKAWLASSPPGGWRLALGKRLEPWLKVPGLTVNRRAIAWSFLAEFPIPIDDPHLTLFAPVLTNKSPELYPASSALYGCLRRGMKVEKDHALRILFPLSSRHLNSGGSSPTGTFGVPYSVIQSGQNIERIIDHVDSNRELIPLYTLEMGQTAARVGAAMELAEKPRHAERAVPLLITNLTSSNGSVQEKCALALAAYGSTARSALPALTNLLEHPKVRVRTAASNAIVAIHR